MHSTAAGAFVVTANKTEKYTVGYYESKSVTRILLCNVSTSPLVVLQKTSAIILKPWQMELLLKLPF